MDELPWQWIRATNYPAAEGLLESIEFLQYKTEAGLVFDLLGDFARLKATRHGLPMRLCRRAELLRQETQVLSQWPVVSSQHLHNTAVFLGDPGEEAETRRVMQRTGLLPLLAVSALRAGKESSAVSWLGRHDRAVHCVAVCPVSGCCISGAYDGTLQVFAPAEAPVAIPIGFMIEAVEFAPNYPHAVVAGRAGQIALVDLQSRAAQPLGQVAGGVSEMKVTRSGAIAHVLHGDGCVSRLELRSRLVTLCHTIRGGECRIVVAEDSAIHEIPSPAGTRPRLVPLPAASPFVGTPEGKILKLVGGGLESTPLSHRVGCSRLEADPTGGSLGVLGPDHVLHVYRQDSESTWSVVHRAVDVACFAWGPDGKLAIGRLSGDVEVHATGTLDRTKAPVATDTEVLRIRVGQSASSARVRVQLKETGLFALVDTYANAHALDQRARRAIGIPQHDAIIWTDDRRHLWWSEWRQQEARMSAPKNLGSTDGEVVCLTHLPRFDMALLGYVDGRIRLVHYDTANERLERRELAGHSGVSIGAVIRAAEAPCEPLIAVLYQRMMMVYESDPAIPAAGPRGLIPLPSIATTLAWDSADAHGRTILVGDEQSWWMRVRVGASP